MFYLYTISCPDTNKVVYVGKTQNYKSRWCTHLSSHDDLPVLKWIRSLKKYGKTPVFNLIDQSDDPATALKMEKDYISLYSKINSLYNVHFNGNRIHKKSKAA